MYLDTPLLHCILAESSVAMRMWRRHGDDTVNIVTKNPYLLASSAFALTGSEGSDEKGGSGLSFKQADMLAHRLGFSRDSPIRLRYSLCHHET